MMVRGIYEEYMVMICSSDHVDKPKFVFAKSWGYNLDIFFLELLIENAEHHVHM